MGVIHKIDIESRIAHIIDREIKAKQLRQQMERLALEKARKAKKVSHQNPQ